MTQTQVGQASQLGPSDLRALIKSKLVLMQGSMGPGNMKRRQKQYRENTLDRLTELNQKISAVERLTQLYKE